VNDALDALAAEGRPPGGRHVGYRRVDGNLEPIPEVAEQLRWAAERVLAGWSLEAIARDFAAKGIPTAKGGRWTHVNVKGALTAPTIAGSRFSTRPPGASSAPTSTGRSTDRPASTSSP
jgi:hypothetical protein